MTVGSFGDIIFQVSNFRVLTFDNFKRNIKAEYAEHKTIGQPPKLEFLHRELEEIQFDMQFIRDLGVNPADEVQKLKDICHKGEANYLVLDNKVYGDIEFVVESFSETVDYFDNAGDILAEKVSVRLKEYVR